jgi:hypothetical protein
MHAAEQLCLGVSGEILRDGKGAVRARAFCVDDALGDALAVEMLHLLQKVDVLEENRPARAGGQCLLHADGRAVGGRQSGFRFRHRPRVDRRVGRVSRVNQVGQVRQVVDRAP